MQTPDKDRLDLWLDKALRQHGSIEARDGMEGRLLATLRSRAERTRAICRWILVLSSPALAVLLVVLVWRGERTGINPNLNAGNVTSQHSDVEQLLGKTEQPSLPPASRDVKVDRTSRHHLSARGQHNEPRLDHFPSPRPPSPEEIVIERYAGRYPQEVALIAQEQQKFDQEIQKAQQEIESQSGISNE